MLPFNTSEILTHMGYEHETDFTVFDPQDETGPQISWVSKNKKQPSNKDILSAVDGFDLEKARSEKMAELKLQTKTKIIKSYSETDQLNILAGTRGYTLADKDRMVAFMDQVLADHDAKKKKINDAKDHAQLVAVEI